MLVGVLVAAQLLNVFFLIGERNFEGRDQQYQSAINDLVEAASELTPEVRRAAPIYLRQLEEQLGSVFLTRVSRIENLLSPRDLPRYERQLTDRLGEIGIEPRQVRVVVHAFEGGQGAGPPPVIMQGIRANTGPRARPLPPPNRLPPGTNLQRSPWVDAETGPTPGAMIQPPPRPDGGPLPPGPGQRQFQQPPLFGDQEAPTSAPALSYRGPPREPPSLTPQRMRLPRPGPDGPRGPRGPGGEFETSRMLPPDAQDGTPGFEELVVSVQLEPDVWINAAMPHYAAETITTRAAMVTGGLLVVSVIVVLLLTQRIARPLNELATAADSLGRGGSAVVIPEYGPADVKSAAKAFNQMQDRISRLLKTQRQVMRAVGHDLRTPLTVMRIRAESLPPSKDSDRIIATLDEMSVMIEEILSWAKDAAGTEVLAAVDLNAMIASMADDYEDSGKAITFEEADPVIVECRRVSLKRAIQNLVDNALKYAGDATVSLSASDGHVSIHVDDHGPGIPAENLEDVLRPFTRLEDSRSRDTGGLGLGLSIVQSAIEAHGGTLDLSNRDEGGLRATLTLPTARAA